VTVRTHSCGLGVTEGKCHLRRFGLTVRSKRHEPPRPSGRYCGGAGRASTSPPQRGVNCCWPRPDEGSWIGTRRPAVDQRCALRCCGVRAAQSAANTDSDLTFRELTHEGHRGCLESGQDSRRPSRESAHRPARSIGQAPSAASPLPVSALLRSLSVRTRALEALASG
jgi:hypothetical protein